MLPSQSKDVRRLTFMAIVGLATAASVAHAGDQEVKDYTKIDPKELGVAPIKPKKDPKTGFLIGGANPTSLIKELKEMNGISIANLEKSMRPNELSKAGFLGKEERLLDVLAADNEFVEKARLTHQEIAKHLRLLYAIGGRESRLGRGFPRKSRVFEYHGVRYRVEIVVFDGFQESPFQDGTKTSTDATVTNIGNGRRLSYSMLVPLTIERYGFYEGKGTRYRVDPQDIIDVLTFLKPESDSSKASKCDEKPRIEH